MFALPACELGKSLREGHRQEPPLCPQISCSEVAMDFIELQYPYLDSTEKVLKSVTELLGHEISMEPSVRYYVKSQYRLKGSVSTIPTTKGLLAINPFHELFGYHYLQHKPIADFYTQKDQTLFIRLIEAEKNGLITVNINPPLSEIPQGSGHFEPDLVAYHTIMELLLPPPNYREDDDMVAATWKEMRIKIAHTAIYKYIFPSIGPEFRRELIRLSREAIVSEVS